MSDEDRQGFDTDAVHAGQEPDPATGARATPIYQTTSYVFEDAEHAADLYALEAEGDVYSRISNPTVEVLEERLATLAGGTGAVATASGMAALDAATFVLASVGDNVVSSSAIYGGTRTYLEHTAGRRGIEARFVDPLDYEAYEEAIDEDTAYVHVETIGNPSLVTPDFEKLADVAHRNGAPLFVDNTFATPALCRPLELGADLVWHSTTKWLHGSGTTLGGVLVDGGNFDWTAERHPEIAGENPAYHGMVIDEEYPDAPVAAATRLRGTRTLGNMQKPFDAWQTLEGLETLHLRMERHASNAQRVAEYLADHEDVAWVNYPGLADHETHDNATEYLEGGYGGMLTFAPEGGFEAAKRVCEETELASFLANVGDAKTLIIHPASTTHAQLSEEAQRESGVHPDMLRVSVGIEDPADVVADLERAIERASAAGGE
ncbi:O-acetylhomoserine aminocarboxypropyltransferase/cysteine synthase family protein [Halospeciosus flavus]|uniref:O-acetylhomoserine aminocarboxypropyltransferase/cysteine synthase family protein n=1 Tax=Halospeciosus flavus TaxID=3032283 RepID=A0ABD5Z784_9EURY|nr:O-acetylhomoserine aminocarboxypropyltransferase/cysteine synthase family protein [Halospeciosus flavus]